MDGKRITKRLVDSLGAGANEYFVWDSKLPGFGIRVQPSGAMSYVVKYRAAVVAKRRRDASRSGASAKSRPIRRALSPRVSLATWRTVLILPP